MGTKLEAFRQKLEKIYPKNWSEIEAAMSQPFAQTFRVNSLVTDEAKVLAALKSQGFEIEQSSVRGGFVNCSSESLSRTEQFAKGEIYIQELASMLPAQVLDPRAGERILDMCAAPGSKTSQLAQLSRNQAEIWAVEKSRSRFFKLQEVLKTQGAKVHKLLNTDAKIIPHVMPDLIGYFDKILLDAPCSNEGHFNLSDLSTFGYWKPNSGRQLSKLQRGLIASAVKLLKPGGILLYSTCTFSIEENEGVVNWILDRDETLTAEYIELDSGIPAQAGRDLNAVRIVPDGVFTGFFLAKLRKSK